MMKNDEKCFLFHLKSSFVLKIFKFFVMTFWTCRKNCLIRKISLQWCCARDLFKSQIPVTTGGFELQISCIQSCYLTH